MCLFLCEINLVFGIVIIKSLTLLLLLRTPMEILSLHHLCNEGLDLVPGLLRLKHKRSHRVGDKFSTHCLANIPPCHVPPAADQDCVLCIVHRETAVATHLFALLLKTLQES